jgi:hypothetical protein
MGQRAAEFARAYAWEKIAAKVIGVYEGLVTT